MSGLSVEIYPEPRPQRNDPEVPGTSATSLRGGETSRGHRASEVLVVSTRGPVCPSAAVAPCTRTTREPRLRLWGWSVRESPSGRQSHEKEGLVSHGLPESPRGVGVRTPGERRCVLQRGVPPDRRLGERMRSLGKRGQGGGHVLTYTCQARHRTTPERRHSDTESPVVRNRRSVPLPPCRG